MINYYRFLPFYLSTVRAIALIIITLNATNPKKLFPKKLEFGAEVRKVTLSGSDHNLAFIGKYLNRGRIQMVNIKD